MLNWEREVRERAQLAQTLREMEEPVPLADGGDRAARL